MLKPRGEPQDGWMQYVSMKYMMLWDLELPDLQINSCRVWPGGVVDIDCLSMRVSTVSCVIYSSSVPLAEQKMPSKNLKGSAKSDRFSRLIRTHFRISFSLTMQLCCIDAQLWLTSSIELPVTISSSFCAVEATAVTPVASLTVRARFSPKKFLSKQSVDPFIDACIGHAHLISISHASTPASFVRFSMLTLIGKCA